MPPNEEPVDAAPPPATCDASTADDSFNCGTCGRTCSRVEYCRRGECVPGCPNKTVYVSPNGSDTNLGCEPEAPKKTIAGAIALVKSLGTMDHSIVVCKGDYAERNLVLDYPVSLLGGYACETFERDEDYASLEGEVTRITNAAPSPGGGTLEIRGVVVDRSVKVDGFVIEGPSSGEGPSNAVLVADGASPTLSNDRIVGGGTESTSDVGSAGVAIDTSSGAHITRCSIEGGSGKLPAGSGSLAGSVAVVVRLGAAAVLIEDSVIEGGSGEAFGAPSASIGLAVQGETARPLLLRRSKIHGGTGVIDNVCTDPYCMANATTGVRILNATRAEIRDCLIHGGDGAALEPARAATTAILAVGTRWLELQNNQLYAGDADSLGSYFQGATIASSRDVSVVNNTFHGGNAKERASNYVIPLRILGGQDALVAHNTILMPRTVASTANNFALAIDSSQSGVIVRSNLFVGNGGDAWYYEDCSSSHIDVAERNAFASFSWIVRTCTTREETIAASEQMLTDLDATTAAENVRIASTCDTDEAGCHVAADCETVDGCRTKIFAHWQDEASEQEKLFEHGLKLSTTSPCVLRTGGANTTGNDGYGNIRTLPTSIGSYELDVPCP